MEQSDYNEANADKLQRAHFQSSVAGGLSPQMIAELSNLLAGHRPQVIYTPSGRSPNDPREVRRRKRAAEALALASARGSGEDNDR